MGIPDDLRHNGFSAQVTQKISDIEEFVRNHRGVVHDTVPSDGWVADQNTWTYVSADAPTFVASVSDDMTGVLSAGMRLWIVQGGVTKYFIITVVGAYVGGLTNVTMYGGASNVLAATAITSVAFSSAKAPYGFPLNPASWTETFTDSTTQLQNTPTANTWYNVGPTSLVIPIGIWIVSYQCTVQVVNTSAAVASITAQCTLSTANNSETDSSFSAMMEVPVPIITGGIIRSPVFVGNRIIGLGAKATYYLNMLTNAAAATSVGLRGASTATAIRAVCAYL